MCLLLLLAAVAVACLLVCVLLPLHNGPKDKLNRPDDQAVLAAVLIPLRPAAMERIKQNLRRRMEDSHQHSEAAAMTMFALGCLSVFFLNHSSKASATFWQFVITFVVNLIPKTDYV